MVSWILRIIIGAATVVLGTFAALLLRGDHIETDLRERAAAALSEDGRDWAEIAVDGRDLRLSGTAPTDGYRSMGVGTAGRVWGVRAVENAAETLPVMSPFVWTAERTADGAVKLTGAVPYGDARKQVAKAFADAGMEVVDEAETAAGAPSAADWTGAAAYAANLLAGLAEGKATITDRDISIAGAARDAAQYAATKTALNAAPPSGFALKSAAIRPPRVSPYTLTVARDGAALSLRGHLPSTEFGAKLRMAAAEHLPGIAIVDETEPGSGAPKALAEAAAAAMAALALFDQGALAFSDTDIWVSGRARHLDTAADVRGELDAALPASFRIAALDIEPPLVEPYYFSAEKRGGGITLSGFYPDADSRAAITETASSVLSGAAVVDALAPGTGAPAGYADMVRYAVGLLPPLAEGQVTLSGPELRVRGRVENAAALLAFRAAAENSVPAGLVVVDQTISTGAPDVRPGAGAPAGQSGPPGIIYGEVPPPPIAGMTQ